MLIKDKETEFKYEITLTEENAGLRTDDYWCNIDILVKNSEFEFKGSNKVISKSELEELIKKVEELQTKATKYEERIIFIKNFFSLYLSNGRNKIIEIKLISVGETKQNYTFKLVNEEITECLNYIKSLDFIK